MQLYYEYKDTALHNGKLNELHSCMKFELGKTGNNQSLIWNDQAIR